MLSLPARTGTTAQAEGQLALVLSTILEGPYSTCGAVAEEALLQQVDLVQRNHNGRCAASSSIHARRPLLRFHLERCP